MEIQISLRNSSFSSFGEDAANRLNSFLPKAEKAGTTNQTPGL